MSRRMTASCCSVVNTAVARMGDKGNGQAELLTSEGFLYFVKDEVHEGIVAFESTTDC